MEKIINTALCSFGMSGRVFHAPLVYLLPGYKLYAVWERSKQLSKEVYPHVIIYTSYEELLNDDAIELVIINTPNYTHYEYAKKALLAGKHIVVEKPFTITSSEAKELIALAKEKNKIISVFQNRRWDSDFKTVKKVVQEKWLGDIVEAEIHFDRYKEELSPKLHKEIPGPGTGLLYDLGSHIIDQALQLFGMPQAIFADITIMRPISKVDDYMELLLFYPSLRVRLKASYLVREPLPAYIFNGTKGSFLKSRADVQEEQLQNGLSPNLPQYGIEPESEKGLLHTEKNGEVTRERIPTEKGTYLDYYQQLYNAIANHQPIPVTAEDGLKVIEIIEAAYKSNQQKQIVEI
jgi:predicted dehydrogenase